MTQTAGVFPHKITNEWDVQYACFLEVPHTLNETPCSARVRPVAPRAPDQPTQSCSPAQVHTCRKLSVCVCRLLLHYDSSLRTLNAPSGYSWLTSRIGSKSSASNCKGTARFFWMGPGGWTHGRRELLDPPRLVASVTEA